MFRCYKNDEQFNPAAWYHGYLSLLMFVMFRCYTNDEQFNPAAWYHCSVSLSHLLLVISGKTANKDILICRASL